MIETYHYTESGLDDIYLINGFEMKDGCLKIHDLEGLHRAIGRWLVFTRKELSGGEMRFLRHELELSQVALSTLLGVNERTVIRWENDRRDRSAGHPSADRTLRLLYIETLSGNANVSEALQRIANLDDHMGRLGEFSYDHDNAWQDSLAA